METTGNKPVKGEKQGFVTSEGDFVDRGEAGQIAMARGQVKKLRNGQLYSEDLPKTKE